MNQNIKKSKSLKNKVNNKVFCENKTRQKRRELSNSATKTINKINSEFNEFLRIIYFFIIY